MNAVAVLRIGGLTKNRPALSWLIISYFWCILQTLVERLKAEVEAVDPLDLETMQTMVQAFTKV